MTHVFKTADIGIREFYWSIFYYQNF